jgi:hypothetical protein
MAINLVHDYPREHRLRSLLSILLRLVGGLLLIVGLLAAVPFLFFLIIETGSFIQAEPSGFDRDGIMIYLEITAVMLVSLLLGVWLLRGRRRLVLFLRRFGFVGATEVLTFALASALGSSWRLITLDDHKVLPVGTGGRIRWTTLCVFLLSLLIPGLLIFWFWHTGADELFKANSSQGSVANLIGGLIAFIVTLLIIIALALLFLVIGMFSLGTYISVRRAERSKRLAIASADQIDPIARRVARRVRRIISPKLVVVRVTNAVWQDSVRRLATVSSAIIVDISEPTQNLLWEISTLKPELRLHWILVAEQQRFSNWTTANESDLNQKLLAVLDGESVLAYSIDRRDRRRFARALRNRLESLARSDI